MYLFWYAVGTNLPFSFGSTSAPPPGCCCCCSGFRLPRLHVRVHVDLLVAGAWQHTAVRVVCEVHRVPCVRSYPSCTIRPHATTHTCASLAGRLSSPPPLPYHPVVGLCALAPPLVSAGFRRRAQPRPAALSSPGIPLLPQLLLQARVLGSR